MQPLQKIARIAGVLYVLLAVVAPLRLLYIPSTLIVPGNATATAANIAAHETLFRLGILSELLAGTIVIFLVLALYRLFEGVDRTLAVIVVILGGIMPATIDFLIGLNDAAALMFVRGPEFLAVFDKPERDALAMMFLRLHAQQVLAAQILWGLWLFPLGLLTYRSGFLPRFLGAWLIVNGVAYLVMSLTGLLWPAYENAVATVAFPALLGEIAFMLWLVVKGVRARPAPPEPAAWPGG